MASLRLQAQIFNLGVQSNLIYRWNFLLRVLVSFVPLLGSVFLWNAVFAGHQAFAGYTFTSMVAYFITLILLDTLTAPNEDDFQIAEDIREGRINSLLLKPLEYRLYRFHLYAAARLVHAAFALVPLAIAMIWLHHYYAGLPWLENLPLALAGHARRGVDPVFLLLHPGDDRVLDPRYRQRHLHHLLGRVSARRPYLPDRCACRPGCRRSAYSLPFVYETFFPAAILIGHVHGAALVYRLLWQWAWVGFFYVLSGILWKRGLHQYTAVGG